MFQTCLVSGEGANVFKFYIVVFEESRSFVSVDTRQYTDSGRSHRLGGRKNEIYMIGPVMTQRTLSFACEGRLCVCSGRYLLLDMACVMIIIRVDFRIY